jgi:predicted secreted protein
MTDDKPEAARDEGDHQLSNSRNIISRDEANALLHRGALQARPYRRAQRALGPLLGMWSHTERQVEGRKPGAHPRNEAQAPCCESGKVERKGSGSQP